MSFNIEIGGQVLSVPREVEAEGPRAVERWVKAHAPTKSTRAKQPKARAARKTARTHEPSSSTES